MDFWRLQTSHPRFKQLSSVHLTRQIWDKVVSNILLLQLCKFINELLCIASQMWCLARLLPVMIGALVPEDDCHWSHFLQLLDIMDVVLSPVVHPDMPAFLQTLIADNLETFRELYPEESIIPKMHYLIHTPRYLQRYEHNYNNYYRNNYYMYMYIWDNLEL